jgi:hypothetical protein
MRCATNSLWHCILLQLQYFNQLLCACIKVLLCRSTAVCLCAKVLLCVTELLYCEVTAYFAANCFLCHSKNAKVNMCHNFARYSTFVLCQCAWALCSVLYLAVFSTYFGELSVALWEALSEQGTMNSYLMKDSPWGAGAGHPGPAYFSCSLALCPANASTRIHSHLKNIYRNYYTLDIFRTHKTA